jgi:hypothetical protein
MSSFRDKIVVAPLWVLFITYAVLLGIVYGLMWWLIDSGDAGDVLFASLIFAPITAAFVTISSAASRRKDRSAAEVSQRDELIEVARATRTGEPPSDRALDRPAFALSRRRRGQLRSERRMNPWLFAAMSLLSLYLVFTEDPRYLVATAFFLALLILRPMALKRAEARLDRLEQAITSRTEGIAPQPGR